MVAGCGRCPARRLAFIANAERAPVRADADLQGAVDNRGRTVGAEPAVDLGGQVGDRWCRRRRSARGPRSSEPRRRSIEKDERLSPLAAKVMVCWAGSVNWRVPSSRVRPG